MPSNPPSEAFLAAVAGYAERLSVLREQVLANTIMCAEIPAPTGDEGELVGFMQNRFNESQLLNVSTDQAGNATALVPGTIGKDAKNILVAAHVDKIWERGVDHTVMVGAHSIVGTGVADNSLGVATIISLPIILAQLGIKLKHNLVLLGATRSMGRGDLAGLRFFLDNTTLPIHSAIGVEGVQLGRLSYSCLGMNRAEIQVHTPEVRDWQVRGRSTAISELNRIVHRILQIPTPAEPKTSIILGSMSAGSGFNVPPTRATVRFEIRSEAPGMVAQIREQIEEIVEEVNAERTIEAHLDIIASRKPGSIGFSHPLVKATRAIMEALEIEAKVAPSTSELSVLLSREIPSLTLGVTHGDRKHEVDESIQIPPIFRGLAQIVAVLQYIDESLSHE